MTMKSIAIVLFQWLAVSVVVYADVSIHPLSCRKDLSAALVDMRRHRPPKVSCRGSYESAVMTPFASPSMVQYSRIDGSNLLDIRGGGFVAGQEMITFGQNLAGTFFALMSVMYGLACGIAPKKSARLFYGFNDKDKTTGRFLIRMIGSLACGIGLTAAFGIASEVEALGHLPTTPEIRHALGIGVLPRIIFFLQALFVEPPSKLRPTKLALGLALVESSLLAFSLSTGMLRPDIFIVCDLAAVLLLSSVSFFKPSAVFKEDKAPSAHESMFTRLLATYKLTHAVLWASLWNPNINALPSVGLASLAWVAALVYITFVRGDVKECGASVMAHTAMMASGVAVAAEGLQNYLVG